jgi:hypothetical protein
LPFFVDGEIPGELVEPAYVQIQKRAIRTTRTTAITIVQPR